MNLLDKFLDAPVKLAKRGFFRMCGNKSSAADNRRNVSLSDDFGKSNQHVSIANLLWKENKYSSSNWKH
jgi:hypothetical protein